VYASKSRPGRGLRIAVVLLVGAVVVVGAVRLAVVEADRITQGLADDERGGCPPTPNCVSTLASDPTHAVEPLACDADEVELLAAVDDALGGGRAVADGEFVVRSTVFGFPDDVYVRAGAGDRVDVLSSSRIGASDLGVNRERVEALRGALAADPRC